MEWTLKELQNLDTQAEINGKWVPARPINYRYRSIFTRIREAWHVFTGKTDGFHWPMGQ
jgi:hypothetical protein